MGSRGTYAGLPLDRGFSRRPNPKASRKFRRRLQVVPLSHHHELHEGLSQALKSRQGHRADQKANGASINQSIHTTDGQTTNNSGGGGERIPLLLSTCGSSLGLPV